MSEFINHIFNENCLTGLLNLPDESVDCCVTSPPYYGLRDYGHIDQIGMESSPEEFIKTMVSIFREVRRVLKKEGTLWLNIGDSYNGSGKGLNGDGSIGKHDSMRASHKGTITGSLKQTKITNLKPKDLIGVPWMLAFALRADGWFLRQDIIWSKPNGMPESVTDRCTKSHEYIFLLSKSANYYFDHQSIKTPLASSSIQRLSQNIDEQNGSARAHANTSKRMPAVGGTKHKNLYDKGQKVHTFHRTRNESGEPFEPMDGLANRRDVWTIPVASFKEAHFATFPEELPAVCIKAGCPHDGIVLDPFMGAGTTAVVAKKLMRNYVGFEINDKYITIAQKRLHNEIGLFQ